MSTDNNNTHELRTERVTLEITMLEGGRKYHGAVSSWDWKAILSRGKNFYSFGESVRVVEDATIGSGDVFRDVGCGSTGDEIVRLAAERDAAIRERDAAKEECERLRVAHLKAALERDRANEARGRIRSEWTRRGQSLHAAQQTIGALNARVAELERAYSAECDARAQAYRELSDLMAAVRERESGEECDHSYAAQCREAAAARERADRMMPAPAANAGGEAKQEPVAWGVRTEWGQFRAGLYASPRAPANLERGDEVVPFYTAPQPPRGWLTSEERKALELASGYSYGEGGGRVSSIIDALLAREMPPRVKVPSQPAEFTLPRWNLCISRWTAAIREAGGEVAE